MRRDEFWMEHAVDKDGKELNTLELIEMRDAYLRAEAPRLIRQLRWILLLAKSEEKMPELINNVLVENGIFCSSDWYSPEDEVRIIAQMIQANRYARMLLTPYGRWVKLVDADLDTLLACVPRHPLEDTIGPARHPEETS